MIQFSNCHTNVNQCYKYLCMIECYEKSLLHIILKYNQNQCSQFVYMTKKIIDLRGQGILMTERCISFFVQKANMMSSNIGWCHLSVEIISTLSCKKKNQGYLFFVTSFRVGFYRQVTLRKLIESDSRISVYFQVFIRSKYLFKFFCSWCITDFSTHLLKKLSPITSMEPTQLQKSEIPFHYMEVIAPSIHVLLSCFSSISNLL